MPLQPALLSTLAAVAQALAPARDPWWIIGSAAVALHTDAPVDVADVDVLLSVEDTHRLLPSLDLMPRPGAPHPRFRSTLFATWRAQPLPVEFMAGFALHDDGGWSPVVLRTRECVRHGAAELPVPSRPELKALLRRFGRPKDLARADLL